jgi:hypothetical protein
MRPVVQERAGGHVRALVLEELGPELADGVSRRPDLSAADLLDRGAAGGDRSAF